jgi:hypothetical protein
MPLGTGRQAASGAQRNEQKDAAQQSDNQRSTTQYLDNDTKWMQLM